MRATVYGVAAAIALSEKIRFTASSPQASTAMIGSMRQAHQTGAQNRGDYNRALDWSLDVERTIQRSLPEHLQDILQLAHIGGLSLKKISDAKSISVQRSFHLVDQAEFMATKALIKAGLIMCPLTAYDQQVDQPTTAQHRHRGTARARPLRRCRSASLPVVQAAAESAKRRRQIRRQVSDLIAIGNSMREQDQINDARGRAIQHAAIRMGVPTMHLAPSFTVFDQWMAKCRALDQLLLRAYARSGSRTADEPAPGLTLHGAPKARYVDWSNIDQFISALELAERHDRAGKEEAEALRELPTSTE